MRTPALAKADIRKFIPMKTFSMQGLWRLALWGAAAASALLIAVMATRGEVGSRRIAIVLSSIKGGPPPPQTLPQTAPPPFDARAETRRLTEAVHDLTTQDDTIKTRLAALEQNVNDITGSIAQVSKSAQGRATPQPWPEAATPVPLTPADIAAEVWPAMPPLVEYGVDIGSALSIPTLRARWAGIKSAHPDTFGGLRPVVTLKQISGTSRVELRLVAGPLPSLDAATQLCASLVPFRLFCEPTSFAGQHLALE